VFRMHQILRSTKQVRGSRPSEPHEPAAPLPPPPTAEGLFAAGLHTPPPAAPQPEETGPLDPESPQAAEAAYEGLIAAGESIYQASTKGGTPALEPLVEAINRAIELFSIDDRLLSESVRQRDHERSWSQRAANGTALSMRLGLEIGYDTRRTLGLGLCALTHDTGMLTLPRDMFNSPGFSPEQVRLLHDHPRQSRRLVEAFGEEFTWIGAIVAQAHERQDGSGYPAGLVGDQIHEFARIIGLADTYEAMSHPRPDRAARAVYNALSEIIDVRNSLFDPAMIKALIHIVSIFPLGSLVKLNSGGIGRVIGANKLYPTRPLLEILIDPQGNKLSPGRLLNLESEAMLTIVDPAIEESVLL
jgi:hypothetical protein